MSRPRFHTQPKPLRSPTSTNGWTSLMMAVIARAEQVKSPHLEGLRHALVNGQTEVFLRRLSIIHLGDIDRELPLK